MDKIISFSLWGNNPKYTIGAIRNAELAATIYPTWKTRFYIASSVPNQIIYALEDIDNVEIILKNSAGDWTGMFWRFEAAFDDKVSVAIFRDTDSRVSLREKHAVDEWLASDKLFHVMRDHPYHQFPILGGMWGVKKSPKFDLKVMLESFITSKASNNYGTDYNFLGSVLYPLIKDNDCLVHDPFFDKKSFPKPRNDFEFVGQVFDENENIIKDHLEVLKNYGKS